MHESRRLKSLARPFLDQLDGSEFSKVVIHYRQKLFRRLWFALLDLRQNASDIGHGPQDSQLMPTMPQGSKWQVLYLLIH